MHIPFDPDRYRHHLDTYDLTEDQKLDLMQHVWSIMEGFVDRAFGQSPEQIDARDKRHKKRDELRLDIASSKPFLIHEFKNAALDNDAEAG